MSKPIPAGMAPNRPSPDGRALGEHLARYADAEAAVRPWLDTRCASCAFRVGTFPNGCEMTLMDAVKCIAERQAVFLCHHKHGGDQKTVCAGFMLLTEGGQGEPFARAPWDFSA